MTRWHPLKQKMVKPQLLMKNIIATNASQPYLERGRISYISHTVIIPAFKKVTAEIWVSFCGKHLNLKSGDLVHIHAFPLVCHDILGSLFETHFSHLLSGSVFQPTSQNYWENHTKLCIWKSFVKCSASSFISVNSRHFLFRGVALLLQSKLRKMNFTKSNTCILLLCLWHSQIMAAGKVLCYKNNLSLAGCLRWLEHHAIHQKIVGSIPSQGTCLGCGFHLLWEATNVCLSVRLKSVSISSSKD